MHLTVDGELKDLLAVSDPVKATMPEALEVPHRRGIPVAMATGDELPTARARGFYARPESGQPPGDPAGSASPA